MKRKTDVIFYSHHAKALNHSVRHKVKKLLEHGCITYNMAEKRFECNPIPGYNKRQEPFKFYQEKLGGHAYFLCPCQGCQKKLDAWHKEHEARGVFPAWQPNCSHLGALYETLHLMNRQRRESKVYVAMNTLEAYQ